LGQGEPHHDEASEKAHPDQIIRELAEGNKLLAGGGELDAVCRHLEVAERTWPLDRPVRWHEGVRPGSA
jgi:hypothetical protein